MPCFLAGSSQATVLARALGVPLYEFSHQQGHIAAALWSAGRMDLLYQRHLAWHLSGGTTELLLIENQAGALTAQKLGGTTDISAGQLIDRTGKLLGLPFPAGEALDKLAAESDSRDAFRVRCHGAKTGDGPATAHFALRSIIGAIERATAAALAEHPGLPVVFSGGVASNSLLRGEALPFETVFAASEYSTDNAMGIALLAWLRRRSHGA